MSHTPGPWTATWNPDQSWCGVDCGTEEEPLLANVATVCLESIELEENDWWDRAKADAFLIAAAPDLLDALMRIDETHYCDVDFDTIKAAKAALAKAKGMAP